MSKKLHITEDEKKEILSFYGLNKTNDDILNERVIPRLTRAGKIADQLSEKIGLDGIVTRNEMSKLLDREGGFYIYKTDSSGGRVETVRDVETFINDLTSRRMTRQSLILTLALNDPIIADKILVRLGKIMGENPTVENGKLYMNTVDLFMNYKVFSNTKQANVLKNKYEMVRKETEGWRDMSSEELEKLILKLSAVENRVSNMGVVTAGLRGNNWRRVSQVLKESQKDIDTLRLEIEGIIERTSANPNQILEYKDVLLNKLIAYERAVDGGVSDILQSVRTQIRERYGFDSPEIKRFDDYYVKSGGENYKVDGDGNVVLSSDGNPIIDSLDPIVWRLKNEEIWQEVIVPNSANIPGGLGNFVRNGFKVIPIKLVKSNNKFGFSVKFPKNNWKRAFNFYALGSATTGLDVLRKMVKSERKFKGNRNVWWKEKWFWQTYLSLIGPRIIIPLAQAALFLTWVALSDELAKEMYDNPLIDFSVEDITAIDLYNNNYGSLAYDVLESLFTTWESDEWWNAQNIDKISFMDLVPIVESMLLKHVDSLLQDDFDINSIQNPDVTDPAVVPSRAFEDSKEGLKEYLLSLGYPARRVNDDDNYEDKTDGCYGWKATTNSRPRWFKFDNGTFVIC